MQNSAPNAGETDTESGLEQQPTALSPESVEALRSSYKQAKQKTCVQEDSGALVTLPNLFPNNLM